LKNDRSLTLLGKYLSLALTLPACVVGGYFLGALLEHWLHIRALRVAGVIFGMISGLLQVFRELSRDDIKDKPHE
jgi:F0F1-type ATP synthase assembly protein I